MTQKSKSEFTPKTQSLIPLGFRLVKPVHGFRNALTPRACISGVGVLNETSINGN
jgi:hypothetical protein